MTGITLTGREAAGIHYQGKRLLNTEGKRYCKCDSHTKLPKFEIVVYYFVLQCTFVC